MGLRRFVERFVNLRQERFCLVKFLRADRALKFLHRVAIQPLPAVIEYFLALALPKRFLC